MNISMSSVMNVRSSVDELLCHCLGVGWEGMLTPGARRWDKDTYTYSFEGLPTPWPANHMEGKRTYFIKQSNHLLVTSDPELAARLDKISSSR
jgi:hypothetical protein